MNIVFITKNIANYISGGRQYSWHIAHCLAKSGHKVDIITDGDALFDRDYIKFPGRENIIIHKAHTFGSKDIKIQDIVKKCDLIIATPPQPVDYAVTWGSIYNKKVIAFLFEPLNVIMEAISDGVEIRFSENDPIWIDFAKQIRKVDMIICNAEYMAKRTKEWLSAFHGPIEYLYNSFNTSIVDLVKHVSIKERENSVVYCSRTEKYKGFGDIPYIFCQTKVKPTIHYISGFIDKANQTHMKFFQLCKEQKMNLIIHDRIGEREKFDILAKSKALFFPSRFEGFGLPPAEAFYVGTPVVCYDLPVLKEIYKDYPHYLPYGEVDRGIETFNQILENDELLFRDINGAQQHVREFASIDNYSEKLNNMIIGFMDGKKLIPINIPTKKIEVNVPKNICVVIMGQESKQLSISLGEQEYKGFNKTDKLDLDNIKEDIIVLCNSKIQLSKTALLEVSRQISSGKDIVYGSFRIKNDKIFVPEFSFEALCTYPTLFCGFMAFKKSILETLLPITSIYWDLEIFSKINNERVVKSDRILFSIDIPIYMDVPFPIMQLLVEKFKDRTDVHELKSVTPNRYRMIFNKNGFIPKSLAIIPVRSNKYFPKLLESLPHMDDHIDYVVVHHVPNGIYDKDLLKLCAENEIPVIKMDGVFNFSKMNNLAIKSFYDNHKIIFLLNDDVILHKDCLKSMTFMFQYRWNKVGVVGTKLLYPNKDCKFPDKDIALFGGDFAKIQHAGVQLLKDRRCSHRLIRMPYNIMSSNIVKECQAVTFAVVAIDYECYKEVGLSEEFPNDYNDIDFCIRANEKGWKVIYDANAVAFHLESASRREFKENSDFAGKVLFSKIHGKLLNKQMTSNELLDLERRGF